MTFLAKDLRNFSYGWLHLAYLELWGDFESFTIVYYDRDWLDEMFPGGNTWCWQLQLPGMGHHLPTALASLGGSGRGGGW